MKETTCQHCGKRFMRLTSARYCSDACRAPVRAFYRQRYHTRYKAQKNEYQRKRRAEIKADPVRHEKSKAYDREWKRKHKEQIREKQKRRYRENREHYLEVARWSNLRTRFGITKADYEKLLAAQGGGCAICHAKPESQRRFAVDHDHATNKVRGILCSNCNTGIGLLNDDPELLARAMAYLHPALLELLRGA